MTLPDEDVMSFLQGHFILGTKNIQKEEHVGLSHGYKTSGKCVGTTNGAGGRNVQFLVLHADGTVLHALPGFWHAKDLINELKLALDINRLHSDDNMTISGKLRMYEMLHRTHMRRYGEDLATRSQWQGFDNWEEQQALARDPNRDTFRKLPSGEYELKSIPEIVHDRMLERPFRKLADFNLETFVDYGKSFYDNNRRFEKKGKSFNSAKRANRKREAEKQKALEQERKDAAKLARKSKRSKRAAK